MNELTYVFQEMPVRTMLIDRDPWFVLVDICTVLGISNSRMVFSRLDDDEKGVSFADTLSGRQEVQVINEPGLYDTIIRSNSEKAKPLRRWVTHDVLPSIRKQGYYSLMSDDELVQFITER